jgi:hypothetical protein
VSTPNPSAPTSTTFVYAYPDGQDPVFYLKDVWVLDYPGGERKFLQIGPHWHEMPAGGKPKLRVHEGFVFDYPTAPTPRYYLREVPQ